MAYNINKSDGTPIQIVDGQIDFTQFSVGIVGKSSKPYGAVRAETTIHMLENFAGPSEPVNPTRGQLWFDTSVNELKLYGNNLSSPLRLVNFTEGTSNIGSSSSPIGLVYGTATSAQYADLAERYEADEALEPGTVVEIGGEKQVTASTSLMSNQVFGVVSTQPGLMLNDNAGTNETHPYIALSGQVPVKVIGTVKKGDRLVSSEKKGYAKAVKMTSLLDAFVVIGRALEDKTTSEPGTVLAAVGAK
jgi:hypothetical protein